MKYLILILFLFSCTSKQPASPIEQFPGQGIKAVFLLNPHDCVSCFPAEKENLQRAAKILMDHQIYLVMPSMPSQAQFDFISSLDMNYAPFDLPQQVISNDSLFTSFFKESKLPSPFLISIYRNDSLIFTKNVKYLDDSDFERIRKIAQ